MWKTERIDFGEQSVIIATGSLQNLWKGTPAIFALVMEGLLVQAKSFVSMPQGFSFKLPLFSKPLPL